MVYLAADAANVVGSIPTEDTRRDGAMRFGIFLAQVLFSIGAFDMKRTRQ